MAIRHIPHNASVPLDRSEILTWHRIFYSPIVVALLVLVIYSQFIITHVGDRESAVAFFHLSPAFGKSHAAQAHSPAIDHALQQYAGNLAKLDANTLFKRRLTGYDGQFYYYIALDPLHAAPYMDAPFYRYGRIGYPVAAWLLALGHARYLPFSFLAVNLLAIVVGTWAVGIWLRRRGMSPWFALLYGLYSGIAAGLMLDVAEPLAAAFVAVGMVLLDRPGWGSVIWAGISFALATLTRETSALFPLVIGIAWLLGFRYTVQRTRTAGIVILGLSLLPAVLWRVVLAYWLHTSAVPKNNYPDLIPLHGLITWWPWGNGQLECLYSSVLPSLVLLAIALWAFRKHAVSLELWLLIANIAYLVLFLPHASYEDFHSNGRLTIVVVLSALFCLPIFDRIMKGNRWWLWLIGALWLAATPSLVLPTT